jgi:hypothetical protein
MAMARPRRRPPTSGGSRVASIVIVYGYAHSDPELVLTPLTSWPRSSLA